MNTINENGNGKLKDFIWGLLMIILVSLGGFNLKTSIENQVGIATLNEKLSAHNRAEQQYLEGVQEKLDDRPTWYESAMQDIVLKNEILDETDRRYVMRK